MMTTTIRPLSERTDDEIIGWVFNTAIFFGCSIHTAGIVAQHFVDGIRADRAKATEPTEGGTTDE